MRLLLIAAIMLSGCAGVASIQHPMIVANHTCEFDLARAGKWPWESSQCIAACRDEKGLSYFYGCSSESLLSGIKAASGIMPTLPVIP